MSKGRTKKNFYDPYSPGFSEKARQLIEQTPYCQNCGPVYTGRLTVAHLDQNTRNDEPENIRVLCQSCHIKYDQPFHVFSMQTKKKQTDNSYFEEKVILRLDAISSIEKSEINILEAFAGDGRLWAEVQLRTSKTLHILKIDMKENKKGVYLKGDNMKFIPLFDFSVYDVIDLDAYGSPYNQLRVCFLKNFRGPILCTFIQSGMGKLNNGMLYELGYTKAMLLKVKAIFNTNGMQKMKDYLSLHQVQTIRGYFFGLKNYFWFKIG